MKRKIRKDKGIRRGKQKDSQAERILDCLERGNSITPLDALNNYGCFRLAPIIFNLRKEGYPIETIKPSGDKKFAIYKINKEYFQSKS
tara:strand:+ start:388 stop:651 length:264 start_codon:yes stop_codon:yes gene_type:complete